MSPASRIFMLGARAEKLIQEKPQGYRDQLLKIRRQLLKLKEWVNNG